MLDNNLSIELSNNNQNDTQQHCNINVVIRVRPIITRPRTTTSNSKKFDTNGTNSSAKSTHNGQQQQQNNDINNNHQLSSAISFPAAGQIQVHDSIANVDRSFAFNVVFEPEANQEQVFEHSGVKRLIDMALDGFACTVFAYGQTSTGKTYTLTGNVFQFATDKSSINGGPQQSGKKSSSSIQMKNRLLKNVRNRLSNSEHETLSTNHMDDDDDDDADENDGKLLIKNSNIGIIQLSFAYLFEQIKRRKNRDQTLNYVITVSYLEVYNEQVLDLLNPSTRPLNVRWSKDRGFYAENLFKIECEDLGDLEGVLEEGCKNRQVRSHSMNENSSRSHSLMTINLFSEVADPDDPQGFIRKEGRLCLVDLAGSEKTKRTNSKGGTFIEANNINRSLLVLGNCIACLADPKRRTGHIPYRDSNLTKLLADSLSGNGMTLMIACISPLKCDSQETISTLRYASRAKRVRMNPVVQMDPRELLILSLKREVRMLRMENQYLRQNCHQIWNENSMNNDNKLMINENNGGGGEQQYLNQNENELLQKYMKENEILRVENVEINLQRNRLVRDHELVCRENEQLLRKLNILLFQLNSIDPNKQHKQTEQISNNLNLSHHQQQQHERKNGPLSIVQSLHNHPKSLNKNQTANLYTSSSSPSILSMITCDNDNNNDNDDDNSNDNPIEDNNNSSEDDFDCSTVSTAAAATLVNSNRRAAKIINDNHHHQQQSSNRSNKFKNTDNQFNESNNDTHHQVLDLTVHGRSAVTTNTMPSSSSSQTLKRR